LLYHRRHVLEGHEQPALVNKNAKELTEEFQRRLARQVNPDAKARERLRDLLFRDAGGIQYDDVEGEFKKLAKQLRWPAAATPKDMRHLFASTMTDAGVPDSYLRYLMGHAPERAALSAYVHLHELERHFTGGLRGDWAPLVDAINARATANLTG
jgi:site-specific recombinase XerD